MRAIFVLVFFLILSACQNSETSKSVDLYNGAGDLVGNAKLSEQEDGVKMKIKLEGLEPGFHGVHVHEYPECKGPDFKTAGNHYNPEGKEHGLMHPEGAHVGDLPNIEADAGGLVDVELMLSGATLLEGKNSIVSKEGTSLIVDEWRDDGLSQPSGDSGARIICGEIRPETDGNKEKSPTDPTEENEEQKEG